MTINKLKAGKEQQIIMIESMEKKEKKLEESLQKESDKNEKWEKEYKKTSE